MQKQPVKSVATIHPHLRGILVGGEEADLRHLTQPHRLHQLGIAKLAAHYRQPIPPLVKVLLLLLLLGCRCRRRLLLRLLLLRLLLLLLRLCCGALSARLLPRLAGLPLGRRITATTAAAGGR